MKEGVIIRRMIKADIEHISQAFIHQGWPGREDILTSYLQEHENRERDVLVAESDGFVAGYITILPAAKHGPFVGVYPELSDFNVFEPFRNRGIGNQLLEEAEKRVRLLSEIVTLGLVYTRVMAQLKDCMSNGAISQMDLEFGLGISPWPLTVLVKTMMT